MGKVAGVVAVAFVGGAVAMELLARVLGGHSEAFCLGLTGIGLLASAQALGGKLGSAPGQTAAPQQ